MEKLEVKTAFDIKVNEIKNSRLDQVDFNNLVFGRVFSDHMFVADYVDGQWQNCEIKPFEQLTLHPASNVFHYGQAIFEGMKAYKTEDEEILLFRPEENARRLNKSAVRMCMPEIPEDLYMLIKKAVQVRKHLERNRQDKDSKFRLILIESRIHRLARYYRTTRKLPANWRYESATASTMVA